MDRVDTKVVLPLGVSRNIFSTIWKICEKLPYTIVIMGVEDRKVLTSMNRVHVYNVHH